MNDIFYDDMIKIVTENKAVFLCGNGFSINFDDRYKCQNLMDSLHSSHCHVIKNADFKVNANEYFKKVLIGNYENVKKELRKIQTEKEFISMFDTAVEFAHTITDNPNVLKWFETGKNIQLTFGFSISELINTISSQANATEAKAMGVNYEYWTILIYCVLAMKDAPKDIYILDEQNIFVKLVLIGGKFTLEGNDIYNDTITNGMYIYFRFLFAGNILLQGDSFNVKNLKNWNLYDFDILNSFLSHFNFLMTTNYDRILEKVTSRTIQHLHGYYDKKHKTVLGQSMSIILKDTKYHISNIIIGDYFISKSVYQTAAKMSSKYANNANIQIYEDMLKENIEGSEANAVIIFGLNIDNDYHILRSIQIHLAKLKNPQIIFCYFTQEDKNLFQQKYEQIMTYSSGLNDDVKNISVSFVKSQEVIANIFKKK